LRRIAQLAVVLSLLVVLPASAAESASLEPVGEFDRPIFVTSDPADAGRLFVVEREGRVIEATATGTAELADLTPWVSCCTGERGLLSIAVAPDFGTTGRFYAAYTGNEAAGGDVGDLHVDSFRPGGSGLIREPVIAIGHADFANHNGGQLQLGPDGRLFISVGDGGGVGDPLKSGQDLGTLLGKVLRIEPRPGQTPSYAIPSGNPFVATAGLDEIWGYGLRNPWRFSFDRATGDMVIADVGQGTREEVDHEPIPAAGAVGGAGANYGWNCREGLIAYPLAPESCDGVGGFTDPVFDYPHTDPEDGSAHGCSITGGYVVRDPSVPDLFGRYVYADFCVGEIRSLRLPATPGTGATGDRSEGLAVANPTSFGEDACGRVYVASNGGAVYLIAGDELPVCPQPAPTVPPPAGPPAPGSPGVALPSSAGTLSVRLTLSATTRRLAGGRKLVRLRARATPCANWAGSVAQLNRGGRGHAHKPLDDNCTARFRLAIAHRSTFRALLPAAGYRSQVLTIALAKPRP
jgi:Glucose / Sorbosone dehydrogenase